MQIAAEIQAELLVSNVISGHQLLVQAARHAVQQWIYRPTLLDGEPVEAASVVDVPFAAPLPLLQPPRPRRQPLQ